MIPISFEDCFQTMHSEMSGMHLPVIMGKADNGSFEVRDLSILKNILLVGAPSQGKTNFIHCLIEAIARLRTPQQVKFVLCDPKEMEFSDMPDEYMNYLYESEKIGNRIFQSHYDIIVVLESLIDEMHSRMDRLNNSNKRNLIEYNELTHDKISNIVVIIDEIADLVTVSDYSQELIGRLAMLGSIVGIHLIISTQRPSKDVISWTIRVNFPTKISFRIRNGLDSIRIIDSKDASKLDSCGEMIANYDNKEQMQYKSPLIYW